MTSAQERMSWPVWISEQPWASGLLAVAEEEARERGVAVVAGHHVTLAFTRDETAVELLQRLGLHARPWRDYINYIPRRERGCESSSRAAPAHGCPKASQPGSPIPPRPEDARYFEAAGHYVPKLLTSSSNWGSIKAHR